MKISKSKGCFQIFTYFNSIQFIQGNLHDELKQVFGNDDRTADLDDINRLPYLDMVLKETERRFTLAAFMFRNVTSDSKIGLRFTYFQPQSF